MYYSIYVRAVNGDYEGESSGRTRSHHGLAETRNEVELSVSRHYDYH